MASTRHALAALALVAITACTSSTSSDNPVSTPSSSSAPTVAPTTAPAATTTVPTTVAPTAPPTVPPTTTPARCVDELSTRARAALLVWPAVYTADWPAAIDVVREHGVGGVLLMEPTGLDAQSLRDRLAELEAASRHGLIVSTDEEGGVVQRLRGIARLPSQRDLSLDTTPEAARQTIADHGDIVRDLGVDMVLGPVVDVAPNVGDVPLQESRFFVGSPDVVADFGAAYLEGWADADLFATLKHYPGHGAASGDTHITDGVTASLDDLADFDLKPYRDLAPVVERTNAAVMIGHLTVPGLTDGVPATRSSAAVDHLRDTLGYGDALLISDALGMAAVGLSEPDASVLALQAGLDVVLFTLTSQTPAIIDAIEQAVLDGELDSDRLADSAAKVMAMLERDGHSCDERRAS